MKTRLLVKTYKDETVKLKRTKGIKMAKRYSHQWVTGICFGITSGVITSLGVIVGLESATSSKLAVVAGIIVMAMAGGLADAAGQHTAEETEFENGRNKHTGKEVWLTTLSTFLSVAGSILTFAIPLLILPLNIAVFVSIGWGMLLLVILNFYAAKSKKESPVKPIFEHILLALFVIIVSHWTGILIGMWLE